MEHNEHDFQEWKKMITSRIRGIYQPPWAVVFSGGGLRAAAHIGVIKAFEENDIFPDMIGGASTGGLIAAAYALGMKSEEILHFFAVQGVRLLGAADERINTEKSCAEERANALIQNGQTLQSILDEFFDQADFSRTKVPCHIVATDLTHGAEIVFSQGSIVNACRAAMSMPGLFLPYIHEQSIVVDGFVINNLPVSVLREKGAEIVIGVNAQAGKKARAKSPHISDVLNATVEILSEFCMQKGLEESDLVIEPKMDAYAMFSGDESDIKTMYEIGYEAAMEKMEEIVAIFVRNSS